MSDAPTAAPTATEALYGAPPPPPTGGLTPDQAQAQIRALDAAMRSPDHPVHHPAHPLHQQVIKYRDGLFGAAYPEGQVRAATAAEAQATTDAPLTGHEAAIYVKNNLALSHAAFDGQPLDSLGDDGAAVRGAVQASVEALGLSRHDTGMLLHHLNAALAAGARNPMSDEQAMRQLARELGGEAQARETVAAANQVLAHLKARGISAGDALVRAGAGNNPALIKQLAEIGRRRAGGGRAPAGAQSRGATMLTGGF